MSARLGVGGRWVLSGLALFAGAWFLDGCGNGSESGNGNGSGSGRGGRRTILLFVWDSVDVDELSLYGNRHQTTPSLARVAGEGLVFLDHSASSDGTNAALASILTGLRPRRHGIGSLHAPGRHALAAEVPTLATILHDAGYRTLAAVALGQLDPDFSGLGRGFDTYEAPALVARRVRRAPETFDALWPALDEALASEAPVFCLLHFADARERLTEPAGDAARWVRAHLGSWRNPDSAVAAALSRLETDPEGALESLRECLLRRRGDLVRELFVRALYAARVSRMDDQLGRVLDALERHGRLADALMVVTGGRAGRLSEPLAPRPARDDPAPGPRAPLIVRSSSRTAPSTFGGITQDVDVFATLLGAAGIAAPEGIDGRDFLRPPAQADPPRAAALIEDVAFERRIARGREWTWISSIEGDSVLRREGEQVLRDAAGQVLRDAPLGYWWPADLLELVGEVSVLRGLLEAELPLGVLRFCSSLGPGARLSLEISVRDGSLVAPWTGLRSEGRERAGRNRRALALIDTGPGSPPSWSMVRTSRRGLPLVLRLHRADGYLGARDVFVGGVPLAELDLPILPVGASVPREEEAEGREPWIIAVEEDARHWRRVRVRAPAGARCLLTLDVVPEPSEPLTGLLRLGPAPDPVSRCSLHATRPGAVLVFGVSPMELTIEGPRMSSSSSLCVSAVVEAERVPRARIEHLGVRQERARELQLAIPESAWVDARLYGRSPPPAERPPGVWIELLDPPPPGPPAIPSNRDELELLRSLGTEE